MLKTFTQEKPIYFPMSPMLTQGIIFSLQNLANMEEIIIESNKVFIEMDGKDLLSYPNQTITQNKTKEYLLTLSKQLFSSNDSLLFLPYEKKDFDYMTDEEYKNYKYLEYQFFDFIGQYAKLHQYKSFNENTLDYDDLRPVQIEIERNQLSKEVEKDPILLWAEKFAAFDTVFIHDQLQQEVYIEWQSQQKILMDAAFDTQMFCMGLMMHISKLTAGLTVGDRIHADHLIIDFYEKMNVYPKKIAIIEKCMSETQKEKFHNMLYVKRVY